MNTNPLDFDTFDKLPRSVKALMHEYEAFDVLRELEARGWKVDVARFHLESKRKFIQNRRINEALGTHDW